LEKFHQTLKPQGRLLCSTPNQRRIPFSSDTHPFHLRHYTPEEFKRLLEVSGFHIEQLWSQKSLFSSELTKGWDGLFNIAVCRKSAYQKTELFHTALSDSSQETEVFFK
jgi:hypothetical protein